MLHTRKSCQILREGKTPQPPYSSTTYWYEPGKVTHSITRRAIFLNYRNLTPYERVWRFARGEILLRPQIHFIDRFVGETDVVLANSGLGLKIPAFACRSVATDRPEYWVKDQAIRRDSVRKVLEGNSTIREVAGVLDTYCVDFILVDTKETYVGSALFNVGDILYNDGQYMLIRVRKRMGEIAPLSTGHL